MLLLAYFYQGRMSVTIDQQGLSLAFDYFDKFSKPQISLLGFKTFQWIKLPEICSYVNYHDSVLVSSDTDCSIDVSHGNLVHGDDVLVSLCLSVEGAMEMTFVFRLGLAPPTIGVEFVMIDMNRSLQEVEHCQQEFLFFQLICLGFHSLLGTLKVMRPGAIFC